MRWMMRGLLGLTSLSIGALGGCGVLDPCDCPDVDPFEGGVFTISAPWEPGVTGSVTADRDEVVIDYTDPDGNVWRVRWAVTGDVP